MPYNARFLYQQPKTEINNYLIVNWFSLPLQTVEKHLVSQSKHICFKNDAFRLKERGIVRLSGDRLGMVSLAFASYTICAKY